MQVESKRIILRFPEIEDAEEFINQSKLGKDFHKGLVNPPKDLINFEQFIARNDNESNRNFLICKKDDEAIIGTINLSQIFYKGFQNAYLGYYLFAEFSGKGFMFDALSLILEFAFQDLKLHRLEANIQPHNSASINLVKKCGFTMEGFSRKYLYIGGKWCDHERWAIIKEDWNANKS
jgi:ribosomal-protein-alanine N-acetyltransferase